MHHETTIITLDCELAIITEGVKVVERARADRFRLGSLLLRRARRDAARVELEMLTVRQDETLLATCCEP